MVLLRYPSQGQSSGQKDHVSPNIDIIEQSLHLYPCLPEVTFKPRPAIYRQRIPTLPEELHEAFLAHIEYNITLFGNAPQFLLLFV